MAAISDTKFRRETSNFKINYIEGAYIPDPNAEDPTAVVTGLLQILPKNLTAEDFMGAIISDSAELGPDMWIRTWVTISYVSAGNPDDPWLALHAPSFAITQSPRSSWFVAGVTLLYNRETGYLVDDNYDDGGEPS